MENEIHLKGFYVPLFRSQNVDELLKWLYAFNFLAIELILILFNLNSVLIFFFVQFFLLPLNYLYISTDSQ